jgi:hypothetical protein
MRSLRREARLDDHLAPALDVAVQQLGQLRGRVGLGLHVETLQALNHLGLSQHLGHVLPRAVRGSLGIGARQADNVL